MSRTPPQPPSATGLDERPFANDRLLTAPEVADLLALPVSWVREATRDNRLPHLKLGRYRRYRREAIDDWLAAQQSGPAAASAARNRTDLRSRPDLSL